LYLLAALAKDYTDIHQLIFLESQQDRDRIYVGSATPDKICQALAVDNAKLVKAYHAAKKIPAPEHDAEVPEKRVAWIAQNFVWQFSEYGGEEQVKEFVTRKSLERYLPIIGNTIEWNGDPPTTLLIYQIVSRPELYVALIRNNGQLNLVVDRLKLAEHVSKITLRQQLESQ